MSSSFSPVITRDDPRSGIVVVTRSPGGQGLDVSVKFPLDSPDTESQAIASYLGVSELQFTYHVANWPHTMFMTDLGKAVVHLHSAFGGKFGNEGTAFVATDGTPNWAELKSAVQPLAKLGHNIFWHLFGLGTAGSGFESDDLGTEEMKEYGRIMRTWLLHAPALQIVAPRHMVPWNLLIADDGGGIQAFWGYSKELQLVHDSLADRPNMDPQWRVVAGVESSAQALSNASLVHSSNDHVFSKLGERVTHVSCPKELFREFEHADVLYHFGHASSSTRGFEFGEVTLNGVSLDAATLRTMLMSGEAVVPNRKPLLCFLNGCSTAVGTPDHDDTIPAVLVAHAKRRLCFITTFGAVPAWPAAKLASHFFAEACSDAPCPIGEALRRASKSLLLEYGSPIGLLYSTWGRNAIRMTTAAAPRPYPISAAALPTPVESRSP